jgi:hypothetical protein
VDAIETSIAIIKVNSNEGTTMEDIECMIDTPHK